MSRSSFAGPIVRWVKRITVTTRISAPPDRVWRALTVPSEVECWDGVTPIDVPDAYPKAGQHARWSTRAGPFRLTLHDRILIVDPPRRFASTIDVGFVHVEEDYHLNACRAGSELISANDVRSSIPGLDGLAARLSKSNVAMSMERLKVFCEERTLNRWPSRRRPDDSGAGRLDTPHGPA